MFLLSGYLLYHNQNRTNTRQSRTYEQEDNEEFRITCLLIRTNAVSKLSVSCCYLRSTFVCFGSFLCPVLSLLVRARHGGIINLIIVGVVRLALSARAATDDIKFLLCPLFVPKLLRIAINSRNVKWIQKDVVVF